MHPILLTTLLFLPGIKSSNDLLPIKQTEYSSNTEIVPIQEPQHEKSFSSIETFRGLKPYDKNVKPYEKHIAKKFMNKETLDPERKLRFLLSQHHDAFNEISDDSQEIHRKYNEQSRGNKIMRFREQERQYEEENRLKNSNHDEHKRHNGFNSNHDINRNINDEINSNRENFNLKEKEHKKKHLKSNSDYENGKNYHNSNIKHEEQRKKHELINSNLEERNKYINLKEKEQKMKLDKMNLNDQHKRFKKYYLEKKEQNKKKYDNNYKLIEYRRHYEFKNLKPNHKDNERNFKKFDDHHKEKEINLNVHQSKTYFKDNIDGNSFERNGKHFNHNGGNNKFNGESYVQNRRNGENRNNFYKPMKKEVYSDEIQYPSHNRKTNEHFNGKLNDEIKQRKERVKRDIESSEESDETDLDDDSGEIDDNEMMKHIVDYDNDEKPYDDIIEVNLQDKSNEKEPVKEDIIKKTVAYISCNPNNGLMCNEMKKPESKEINDNGEGKNENESYHHDRILDDETWLKLLEDSIKEDGIDVEYHPQ